jgi:predicted ribosomally synthesized peptide with nif11-like leader
MEYNLPLLAMSEEQLAALLANLRDDARLQEKLNGAADLDAALAIAKDAGFDISKADWLRYQANQTLELSDEELLSIAGGMTAGMLNGNDRFVRALEDYYARRKKGLECE